MIRAKLLIATVLLVFNYDNKKSIVKSFTTGENIWILEGVIVEQTCLKHEDMPTKWTKCYISAPTTPWTLVATCSISFLLPICFSACFNLTVRLSPPVSSTLASSQASCSQSKSLKILSRDGALSSNFTWGLSSLRRPVGAVKTVTKTSLTLINC